MNFHCPRCDRQVEAAGFRAEGSALFLRCASCGEEARAQTPPMPALRVIAGEGQGAPEDSFAPPPGHCPKCIAVREPELQSCPQCGLVFENFVEAEVALVPPLRERWSALLGRWSEPGEHELLLRHAADADQLPQLARVYRIRLARVPNDAQARRALEQLVATISSASLKPASAPANPRWVRWLTWAVALAGLVVLAAVWFKVLGHR
jgi:hypothetical protein